MYRLLSLLGRSRLAALSIGVLAVWFVADAARNAWAQEKPAENPGDDARLQRFNSIDWQHGPGVGKLGTIAEIKIPKGCFHGTAGRRQVRRTDAEHS